MCMPIYLPMLGEQAPQITLRMKAKRYANKVVMIKSEGKCTKPHPCIFFTLEYNCSVKDVGLIQEIQFLEFMGGSNLMHARLNYLIACITFE